MSSWTDKRPMSPHLWTWRWHITMWGSIIHRATGMAAYVGVFLVVAWLFSLAAGPGWYEPLAGIVGSIFGQLILFGFTVAVLYHTLNGVRHLFWDAGAGFNPKFASFTGAVVFVLAGVGSVAIWLLMGLVPGIDPLHMAATTAAGAAS